MRVNFPFWFGRSRLGRVKSADRTAGDAARDRRDWATAAAYYRRHVETAKLDIAIWVQLGHALKESGTPEKARLAYEEAVRLAPADPDALVSLGQIHRILGDRPSAIEYFQRAVASSGDAQGLAELEREGVPAAAVRRTTSQQQQSKVIQSLRAKASGLTPLRTSDIRVEGEGFALLSQDPWVEFRIDEVIRSPLALLEIDARSNANDAVLSSQIYVDQGVGYEEHQSVRFSSKGPLIRIIIVNPTTISTLRWDPDRREGQIAAPSLTITEIATPADLEAALDKMAPAASETAQLRMLLGMQLDTGQTRSDGALPPLISFDLDLDQNYAFWLLRNEFLSDVDLATIMRLDAELVIRPRFSFIMPTYNTPLPLLRECLDSLFAQTYTNFEICIADDHSTDPGVLSTLSEYAERDPRLRFVARQHNGHISAASNSALSLATGDFVVLVDHDDLIPIYALLMVAIYINRRPDADILFSDEDKITLQGKRLQPYFKSDFNKYLMYGHNMISHLGVYRRTLIDEVGGFRLGLEGSQDYDLFLRCYEKTDDKRVVHIPHVLYHWRILPGSTALSADQKNYAVVAAQEAINGHFERTGLPLRSQGGFAPGCTAVRPSRNDETPLSIMIPTRDGLDVLEPCISSILAKPHEATEIIIVDNGSTDPATLDYLSELTRRKIAEVLRFDAPFNFSAINNYAAQFAKGEYFCFLNNDTEVVSEDWISRARNFLSIDEIGAVGARLIFPDGLLQHFGIVAGMGMHGVAGTPHGGTDASLPGYFGKARLLQEVSAVTAACMFVRKTDFEAVGGFCSDLTVSYNDVDLCLKLRQRGLRILVDPDITLIHKESRTRGSDKTGAGAARLEREAALMRTRWTSELAADPYYSPNHDIARFDFALAQRPRVPWPWRETEMSSSVSFNA